MDTDEYTEYEFLENDGEEAIASNVGPFGEADDDFVSDDEIAGRDNAIGDPEDEAAGDMGDRA